MRNEQKIENYIYEVMRALNIDRMPTSKEVRDTKIPGLDSAISRTGGYVKWANKLNLTNKKPTKLLSEDEIKKEILKTVEIFNLNRMPTRKEILDTNLGVSLHNAISRGNGYYEWAKILNLEIKDSETFMGIQYENLCKEQLINFGYAVETTPMKAPYDLLVNDNIRIDVKSGCAYYINGCRTHTFTTSKKYSTCDIYVMYALNEDGSEIERVLVIPSKLLNAINATMGTNSKYNVFIDRWDYIGMYDDFYNKIII